jgi:hypothetical protein
MCSPHNSDVGVLKKNITPLPVCMTGSQKNLTVNARTHKAVNIGVIPVFSKSLSHIMSMSKRSRSEVEGEEKEEEVEVAVEEDVIVSFSEKLAGALGKTFCYLATLSRDDLIKALIETKDMRMLSRDTEVIKAVVTTMNGDKTDTIMLPCGQGLSSIWALKEKVKDVFGIDEKRQTLVNTRTGLAMEDQAVMKARHLCLEWNFTLFVKEASGGFAWYKDTRFELPDEIEDVSILTSAHRNKMCVVPKIVPAKGFTTTYAGVYSISFAVYFSNTRLGNAVPRPQLTKGCYFGLRQAHDDSSCERSTTFAIDAFSGKVWESRHRDETAEGHYQNFLCPGKVLTMKVNCAEQRLYFYRDSILFGSLRLENSTMMGMQFMAHIPVPGFEIYIVDDAMGTPIAQNFDFVGR